MSIFTLKDRMEGYQSAVDFRLLPKLPVITLVNGRSFSKVTSLLDKPFCPQFSQSMVETAHFLCKEMEGAIFAYVFNDEIVVISRNDQNEQTAPWFDNRLQKINSAVSAIATLHFARVAPNNLVGDGIFLTESFVVPNITEAINAVIFKQQQNFHIAVQAACFFELIKKYDRHVIREMLSGLSLDEKIDILAQETSISFEDLPVAFRRGIALYRAPRVINETVKNRWVSNVDLPIFSKETAFLGNILRNGSDIVRKDSL
jgi:tRNA(His) 5'-end guanylyltransferase